MDNQALVHVPRNKRPDPAELEGYKQEYPNDPDFSRYPLELHAWLYDNQRREEQNRDRDGNSRIPLPGHESNLDLTKSRSGFDPQNFNLDQVIKVVRSRPRH